MRCLPADLVGEAYTAFVVDVFSRRIVGPDLPADHDWHPMTRAWWLGWRSSPQARVFGPVDWEHLLIAAVLHTRMWSGESTAAGEVRLWSSKFGATGEDRARLHWALAD
ncbi:MAG: hypothetical protein ACKOE2_14785 [Actinomycetales bacterium]